MTINEEPEDARALWIQFKGREWIIMYNDNRYTAFPCDSENVTKAQVENLFRYLSIEGFINHPEPPNNPQPANI